MEVETQPVRLRSQLQTPISFRAFSSYSQGSDPSEDPEVDGFESVFSLRLYFSVSNGDDLVVTQGPNPSRTAAEEMKSLWCRAYIQPS